MAEFEHIGTLTIEPCVLFLAAIESESTVLISHADPQPERPSREPAASAGSSVDGTVAEAMARLTAAGIPLAGGLAAYGEELPAGRARSALRKISQSLTDGASLDDALAGATGGSAAYISGLVAAGVRTGRLAEALERHLTVTRRTQQVRSRILLSLGYPLLLGCFALVIFWIMLAWPLQDLKSIYEGFEVALPSATVALLDVSDWAALSRDWFGFVLSGLMVTASFFWAMHFAPGHPIRIRVYQRIPAIGTASRHAALAEFCSLLSILTGCDVPLPEALRLTASALRDGNLREGARRLAETVEKGASAEDEVRLLPNFPNSLSALFRWTDRNLVFSESLRTAGELHAAQARIQAGVVGVIVQPLLLFAIAGTAVGFAYIVFMPLIALLSSLT